LKAPEAASAKLWRWQEALEVAGSSRGGRRVWRRSKGLEKVEGKNLESVEGYGSGRKFWMRSKALEEVRDSGGGRRLRR
jgi:hypothetical protein